MTGRYSKFLTIGFAFVASGGSAQTTTPAAEHPNLDGVWQVEASTALTSAEPMAPDGQEIPFLPWTAAMHEGAKVYENNLHFPWPPNNQRCLVAGTIRAMKGNFPWRMITTKDQVTILYEEDGRFNIFPFRSAHEPDLKPTWWGDAIARWDGDTLVVDQTGFNGKTPFPKAIMHTTALRVVHHFRLIEGGTKLEDRFTIDDPGAFSRVWESRSVFVRKPTGYKLRDYRCAENNRDLPTRDGKLTFWQADWGPD